MSVTCVWAHCYVLLELVVRDARAAGGSTHGHAHYLCTLPSTLTPLTAAAALRAGTHADKKQQAVEGEG